MKIESSFIITILLLILSCNERHQQITNNGDSQVVKANGYEVPKDSMAIPKSVPAGKPTVVKAGKPTVVPARTNIRLAGIPKTVIAGTPKICTPGKDSFAVAEVVPAISKPFLAGTPETVTAKDPRRKDQNANSFSFFGRPEGLKGDLISCLVQDHKGNLWIGAYGGVSRYDGKNFTNFTEKEGLYSNSVWSMIEDRSGNLWIGGGGGVSKYDGKYFTHYTTKEGMSGIPGWSILEDKAGNIWFGTYGGVSRFDGKTFTNYTTKQGLVHDVVTTIFQDRAGIIWFGTGGGVSEWNGKSFTNYTEKQGLSEDTVLSILEDSIGNLWFGTKGGVCRFDGKTFMHYSEKEGLINNEVNRICVDKSGNKWFGTSGGVSKYDGRNFTNFSEEDGLSNNTIFCILEDISGILWVGTDAGLSKYNGKTFTQFSRKEGLINDGVSSIFDDGSGNLWFGTYGGVSRYDGKYFTQFTEKEGLSSNLVWGFLKDQYGKLWLINHDKGVSRYDGKIFEHFTEKEGLGSNSVHCLLEDKAGNLWFGTPAGATKYDGRNFTYYTEKEGLSNNDVLKIIQDKSGALWFGTARGLTKYNDGLFTHYTIKEGLNGKFVSGLEEDKDGNLWISTNAGVSKFDGTTFTQISLTEKDGYIGKDIIGMSKDRTGNLWLGSTFGLNKLNPESLSKGGTNENTSNSPSAEILFKSFTYEDGLFTLGSTDHAFYADKRGNIWMANTAFHSEAYEKDTIAPSMQLTGVALFNENIPWEKLDQKKDTSIVLGNGVSVRNFRFDGISNWYYIPEHLSLPYDNNYVTFNFLGITTKSPQKVRYQYKLEGLDDNWSGLTTRTEAPYGNLPPNDYIFKVKAMNSDGYWSEEFNYSFTVRPPWWQTWWFRILAALAVIAVVYGIIIYRSRNLKKRNIQLERKVSERTGELNQSLLELKTTQDQLIHSEKMASLGELTSGIAHEIKNPLNFINNFSELNLDLMAEIEEEQLSKIDENTRADLVKMMKTMRKNSEKINHHGKRVDEIVKSMLQHSRVGNLTKEPINVNLLCEESLKLAYHGFKAKEKTFNASFETHFDTDLPLVMAIPQDFSRVLLNLFNNAFYAVHEKKRKMQLVSTDALETEPSYAPVVNVSTRKTNNKVVITVSDNGMGIPTHIIGKIFQPFFTTKPTGEGTGLGLSMSYDIVTKSHGGELLVKSNEGMGTDFEIILPG